MTVNVTRNPNPNPISEVLVKGRSGYTSVIPRSGGILFRHGYTEHGKFMQKCDSYLTREDVREYAYTLLELVEE